MVVRAGQQAKVVEMPEEAAQLKTLLEDVRVDRTGVVSLEASEENPVRTIAGELLPGAKSVIVLAMELFPELVRYLTSEKKVGELVLRDLFDRNADIANGHLDWESYKLVKELHKLGYRGIPLPAGDAPFDRRFVEGMLSYKTAAVLAGLGVIGWNTLLLTPEYGARVRLSCIVTDAPLENTPAGDSYDPCSQCGGACVKICPVKALKQPENGERGNIDRFLCNNYLTATGGCSECLRVCPADRLYQKHSVTDRP
jgi:epoxyqueuosine reductase